jgi:hypothetical protein
LLYFGPPTFPAGKILPIFRPASPAVRTSVEARTGAHLRLAPGHYEGGRTQARRHEELRAASMQALAVSGSAPFRLQDQLVAERIPPPFRAPYGARYGIVISAAGCLPVDGVQALPAFRRSRCDPPAHTNVLDKREDRRAIHVSLLLSSLARIPLVFNLMRTLNQCPPRCLLAGLRLSLARRRLKIVR